MKPETLYNILEPDILAVRPKISVFFYGCHQYTQLATVTNNIYQREFIAIATSSSHPILSRVREEAGGYLFTFGPRGGIYALAPH